MKARVDLFTKRLDQLNVNGLLGMDSAKDLTMHLTSSGGHVTCTYFNFLPYPLAVALTVADVS